MADYLGGKLFKMEVMVYGDVQFANIRYQPYPLISQAIVEQYKRIWGDTQFKDHTDCFLAHAGIRGDGISLYITSFG